MPYITSGLIWDLKIKGDPNTYFNYHQTLIWDFKIMQKS